MLLSLLQPPALPVFVFSPLARTGMIHSRGCRGHWCWWVPVSLGTGAGSCPRCPHGLSLAWAGQCPEDSEVVGVFHGGRWLFVVLETALGVSPVSRVPSGTVPVPLDLWQGWPWEGTLQPLIVLVLLCLLMFAFGVVVQNM